MRVHSVYALFPLHSGSSLLRGLSSLTNTSEPLRLECVTCLHALLLQPRVLYFLTSLTPSPHHAGMTQLVSANCREHKKRERGRGRERERERESPAHFMYICMMNIRKVLANPRCVLQLSTKALALPEHFYNKSTAVPACLLACSVNVICRHKCHLYYQLACSVIRFCALQSFELL